MNFDNGFQLPTMWNPILNPPPPPFYLYFHLFYVLFLINKNVLFIFIVYFIFTSFLLASSPRSSSLVKHTRPLVAVLKSSHSCSSFSFVADEDLHGLNMQLLTSFLQRELLRYLRVSTSPTSQQTCFLIVSIFAQHNNSSGYHFWRFGELDNNNSVRQEPSFSFHALHFIPSHQLLLVQLRQDCVG